MNEMEKENDAWNHVGGGVRKRAKNWRARKLIMNVAETCSHLAPIAYRLTQV